MDLPKKSYSLLSFSFGSISPNPKHDEAILNSYLLLPIFMEGAAMYLPEEQAISNILLQMDHLFTFYYLFIF